ncbi:amidohydrolase [Microbacterium sp.]|uniref:amidohydrolase n=1 Tax=Microbacterium sp. TaxID=51671 RepID=UPI003C7861A1
MTLLLRAARIPGRSAPVDVLVSGDRVTRVASRIREPAARVVDLDGRFLRPGLWDSHVHFTQWVIARARVDLASASSAAETVDLVRRTLPGRTEEVVVGYGFRDGLWPDAPTRDALDAVAPRRPVVLVSGDLHCGWLNSAAARLLGAALPADGVLREAEWIGTLDRLDAQTQPRLEHYRDAAAAAAARGLVGIVEFENADNPRLWPERVAAGVTTLRVEASVWPDRLEQVIARGLRTGDRLEASGLATMGRLKIVADGSLNTRTAFCWDRYPDIPADHRHPFGIESVAPAELERIVARAHAAGILPAVHAIGDRGNTEVIDVFERLGIAGTIEHAQLVTTSDLARFGRLRLTASVQPEHAVDDRDVAGRHWRGRTDRAFAFRSLLDAGATLALGSDAPVAPLDPWISIAAAVSRTRGGRPPWHPEQRLDVGDALAASSRGRRAVVAGEVADLIVLESDPLASGAADGATLRTFPVAATLLGGRFTHTTLEG